MDFDKYNSRPLWQTIIFDVIVMTILVGFFLYVMNATLVGSLFRAVALWSILSLAWYLFMIVVRIAKKNKHESIK